MAELAIAIPEKESYVRIPYEFYGHKLPRRELLMLGKVFSFSKKGEEDVVCRAKYTTLAKDFRCSVRTIGRAVRRLSEKGLIEFVGAGDAKRATSKYRYVGADCGKGHSRVDLYLLHTEFEIRNVGTRYLTVSEAIVLCYMKTHCENPRKKRFSGTVRSIAKNTSLSPTTVQSAIDVLLRAELISRAGDEKAVNGSSQSIFHVNEKLLRKAEKAFKKEMTPTSAPKDKPQWQKNIDDIDAKAERERYYSRLKYKAEDVAERHKARLMQDAEYSAALSILNKTAASVARAELSGDKNELRDLIYRRSKAQAIMQKRMKALGIAEADITPRYRCVKCSDSGFLPSGKACDCYPLKERT